MKKRARVLPGAPWCRAGAAASAGGRTQAPRPAHDMTAVYGQYMSKLVLGLALALTSVIAWAQSPQEVEYGVLQAGPGNWSWGTSAGGFFGLTPLELFEHVTGDEVPDAPPQSVLWEERFLNHFASWGWRLIATVPQPDGGVKYVLERACSFEPSGCYAGE